MNDMREKTMSASDMLKKLGRLGGYADGNYQCTCSLCRESFVGDKRAIHCLPCAAAGLPNPDDVWDDAIEVCAALIETNLFLHPRLREAIAKALVSTARGKRAEFLQKEVVQKTSV